MPSNASPWSTRRRAQGTRRRVLPESVRVRGATDTCVTLTAARARALTAQPTLSTVRLAAGES
jgi:hypothetical protein